MRIGLAFRVVGIVSRLVNELNSDLTDKTTAIVEYIWAVNALSLRAREEPEKPLSLVPERSCVGV
jgi:hypothetical protein